MGFGGKVRDFVHFIVGGGKLQITNHKYVGISLSKKVFMKVKVLYRMQSDEDSIFITQSKQMNWQFLPLHLYSIKSLFNQIFIRIFLCNPFCLFYRIGSIIVRKILNVNYPYNSFVIIFSCGNYY